MSGFFMIRRGSVQQHRLPAQQASNCCWRYWSAPGISLRRRGALSLSGARFRAAHRQRPAARVGWDYACLLARLYAGKFGFSRGLEARHNSQSLTLLSLGFLCANKRGCPILFTVIVKWVGKHRRNPALHSRQDRPQYQKRPHPRKKHQRHANPRLAIHLRHKVGRGHIQRHARRHRQPVRQPARRQLNQQHASQSRGRQQRQRSKKPWSGSARWPASPTPS